MGAGCLGSGGEGGVGLEEAGLVGEAGEVDDEVAGPVGIGIGWYVSEGVEAAVGVNGDGGQAVGFAEVVYGALFPSGVVDEGDEAPGGDEEEAREEGAPEKHVAGVEMGEGGEGSGKVDGAGVDEGFELLGVIHDQGVGIGPEDGAVSAETLLDKAYL